MASYVVVYDGVCNLCNGIVRFIIRHDSGRKFRFAPMQSEAGRSLIDRHYEPDAELDTFLVIGGGVCRVRSDAALAIVRELDRPWPLLGGLRCVPGPVRDFLYGLVARRRYRLFGRRESCRLPDPEVADRFLG